MITIPQMLSFPSFGAVTLGTFGWPALGVVFAWFLVLTFLGCVVGIIREHSRSAPAAPAERTTGSALRPIRPLHFPARHVTREAA